MASRGTCTLLREMSEALAGLPWRGDRWEGDREWNSGLPGAEPWPWALMWARAGEPGVAWWSREGEAGEPCLVKWRGAAAVAGIPKLPPLAITWLDKWNITESGSLWEHKAQQINTCMPITRNGTGLFRQVGGLCTSFDQRIPSWPGLAGFVDCVGQQQPIRQGAPHCVIEPSYQICCPH